MKYKVGDVVMVRDDLSTGRLYNEIGVNTHMLAYRNNFLTIKFISTSCAVPFYRVEENSWAWTDDMFVFHIDQEEDDVEAIDYDMFKEGFM